MKPMVLMRNAKAELNKKNSARRAVTALLAEFFLFNSAFGGRLALITTNILLDFNQCPCLPKAELNTKNKTKQSLLNGRLVLFLVFISMTYIGPKVFHMTVKAV